MTVLSITNLAIGVIELSIVGLILRESWGLGLGRPPIIWALASFFAIDAMVAVNRSEVFWQRSDTFIKGTMLDMAGLLVLFVVVFNARRLVHSAVAALDLAAYRSQEYERARRDYTQVVRHRIMNPLTVILGATQTLRAGALTNEELAPQLLSAIEGSAEVIQHETLAPERRDDLERDLDAVPGVVADSTLPPPVD